VVAALFAAIRSQVTFGVSGAAVFLPDGEGEYCCVETNDISHVANLLKCRSKTPALKLM
jgi:hypothetical protein